MKSVVDISTIDQLNFFNLFLQADIFVKAVIFILALASFWSWAITIDKYIKFANLRAKAKEFNKIFWSGKMINEIYDYYKKHNDHPFSNVFISAINEWEMQTQNMTDNLGTRLRLRDRIYDSMTVTKNRAMQKLESNIEFLATIASATPFIGLLGTVWGIMNSFKAIAGSNVTNISVVAPGIAEALLATAVGLFAAIPASIFFNILINKFNKYNEEVDDFCLELLNILTRELDK